VSRFGAGSAIGAVGGYLAFRERVFHPDNPEFHSLTLAALTAAMLTLVRLSCRPQALALAVVYAFFRSSLSESRWNAALGGLFLALGVFVVAEIFDDLGRRGFRFGKFLFVGPLLGGALIAVGPLLGLHELTIYDAARVLFVQLLIGIVIGDGVGLGIELVEGMPDGPAEGARGSL
jgi:hypothetical protein